MAETVLLEKKGVVLSLTLNRPEKLNCINWEMMATLSCALDTAEADASLRLIVFMGAGDRAFSTGGDLKEFRNLDAEGAGRWIRTGQRIFDRVAALPALTVAVIDGFAYGGGMELALACDFRLATPTASLAAPELQLGWPPGWGALTRLGRAVGEVKAREIILLGEAINAREALDIGLVNWVCEVDEVGNRLDSIAQKAANLDPCLIAFSRTALAQRSRSTQEGNVDTDVIATLYSRLRSSSN